VSTKVAPVGSLPQDEGKRYYNSEMARLALWASFLLVALFLLSCGGGSSSETTPPAESATPATPTPTADAEPGVSGVVFEDKNGNGVRDEGERGVEWDLSMCMSDMCRPGTTDGTGRFHFDKVIPGRNSIILANVVTGWQRVVKDCDAGTFTYHEGEHKTVDLPVRFVGKHASGYGGSVWKDGAPPSPGTRVEAMAGGEVCGETTTCGLRESRYTMWVASAEEEEGCGEEGAEVRFRVDGAAANQASQWHHGESVTLDLFVGPEPAVFEGSVSVYRSGTTSAMTPVGTPVQAYVADQLCGEGTTYTVHPGPNMYQVAVLPEGLRAGCAREGATVTFTIGGQPANEEAVWQSGVHRVELSVGEAPSPTP
jgi:hypothetical protein